MSTTSGKPAKAARLNSHETIAELAAAGTRLQIYLSQGQVTIIQLQETIAELAAAGTRLQIYLSRGRVTIIQTAETSGTHKTSQQTVKMHTPVPRLSDGIKSMLFPIGLLLGSLFWVALGYQFGAFVLIISLFILATSSAKLLQANHFDALSKNTSTATIIHREVVSSSGKGGTTYTYHIVFTLYVPQTGTLFFNDLVPKKHYKLLAQADELRVEYAVEKPWLARRF